MFLFELPSEKPLHYHYTGKFEAPSPNWIHDDFLLTEYELFVMTEGTLYLSYNQESFTVNTGEFLLLPPSHSPHAHRKGFKPSYCSFYWLHFTSDTEPLLKEVSETALSGHMTTLPLETICVPRQGAIPMPEKVIVLMKQLQDAVKNHYPSTALNVMTTSVLMELYSQFYVNNQVLFHAKASQKQIYHDIVDYVKLNVSKNLKVIDVAAHFGYNEKYLSHLFAAVAGIPLKQFILTHKVDAANFMLTDTNKSVSVISQELGFPDSHNFARAYKKITGLSPSEYRNAFARRMLFHK